MKRIILIILITLCIITGCSSSTNTSQSNQPVESWLYALSHDTFFHEYSVMLYQYSKILSLLSEAKSATDISYIKGRIDSCTERGMTIVKYTIQSQFITHEIIEDKETKKDIIIMLYAMNYSLENYQKKLYKNDLSFIKDITLFKNLSNEISNLNVSNEDFLVKCKSKIVNITKMINSTLENKK